FSASLYGRVSVAWAASSGPRSMSTMRPSCSAKWYATSPSGVPVITRWIVALAPARSGGSANARPTASNHSSDRYVRAMDPPQSGARSAQTGEQVVFGQLGRHPGLGQLPVLPRVQRAQHLVGQPEPERRLGVDLGGVGAQGGEPDLSEP